MHRREHLARRLFELIADRALLDGHRLTGEVEALGVVAAAGHERLEGRLLADPGNAAPPARTERCRQHLETLSLPLVSLLHSVNGVELLADRHGSVERNTRKLKPHLSRVDAHVARFAVKTHLLGVF